jgi:type I site-specific restriction endonuclease
LMTQVREEIYFTKGRVIVRNKRVRRGEASKADYILFYRPNVPLAVIEAKDNNHSVGDGMQQAIAYAETLDIPFAYSSNGSAFLEHDRTGTGVVVEREIPLDQFPSATELWNRYCSAKGYTALTTRPKRALPLRPHSVVVHGRPRKAKMVADPLTATHFAPGSTLLDQPEGLQGFYCAEFCAAGVGT